jgi:hypothetical protein
MASALVIIVAVLTNAAVVATGASAASASSAAPQHIVIDRDTTWPGRLTLRAGDSIQFLNGARLSFGPGGSADWQGTPTQTWSNDGNVQNLARDINIFGHGDIRFEAGSLPSIIRYVNVNLQPLTELGRYPLHWHHAGDGVRGTLVEGVVVMNSTNRAFVPHASHGITFRDTIAKNTIGDAYWWDPPPNSGDKESNNSNDITYDHALADGVTSGAIHDQHRFSAFRLGSGSGNTVINSAAMNVEGGRDSSGFHWPEDVAGPRAWRFENNVAHHNSANGIFVWQNSNVDHLVDGYRGYANGTSDIDHGAYSNIYAYRNVTVDDVQVHALGWSVTGGTIGTVETREHRRQDSSVTFSDVAVGRLIVDNDRGSGDVAGHYVFTNTGLTFNNVTVRSAVSGTKVTINGETRTFAFSNTPGHPIGLVDPAQGEWHLRSSNGSITSFFYGNPNDIPFLGDWDCDGDDTPGLFRQSDAFAYLRNSNSQGNADRRFFFGNPSDIPLAGDFNGNGCDTVSIYRPSTQQFFIVNALGKDGGGLGAADTSFIFGNPGDKPVVGDWDGDGIDEVGLHRESTGLFYWRNTLNTGVADGQIFFGDPGDRFVSGDWGIVDDKDTPAVFRPSNTTFFFRHTLTQGVADSQFVFGQPGWLPVAGDFGLG